MSRKSVVLMAATVAVAAFLTGRITGRGAASNAAVMAASYHCPMHPGYTSAKPGNCPQCGMKLTATRAVPVAETQFGGVKVYEAARTIGARRFRTLGRVTPIQSRIYRISTGSDGWIRQVHPVATGSLVKKDQPLASFYSREFIASQQSFFYALSSEDRERQAPSTAQQQEAHSRASGTDARDAGGAGYEQHPNRRRCAYASRRQGRRPARAGGRIHSGERRRFGTAFRKAPRTLPHRRPAKSVGDRRPL